MKDSKDEGYLLTPCFMHSPRQLWQANGGIDKLHMRRNAMHHTGSFDVPDMQVASATSHGKGLEVMVLPESSRPLNACSSSKHETRWLHSAINLKEP